MTETAEVSEMTAEVASDDLKGFAPDVPNQESTTMKGMNDSEGKKVVSLAVKYHQRLIIRDSESRLYLVRSKHISSFSWNNIPTKPPLIYLEKGLFIYQEVRCKKDHSNTRKDPPTLSS